MNTYAIILNEPSTFVWQNIEENWPGREHYFLTDRIAFIVNQDFLLTGDIASSVGVSKDGGVSGLVFDTNALSGWNDNALNEWLENVS
ncbi:MAG: hypothetical protein OXC63_05755 [Aestuariivita sp.]|nr:hypothetical protein [Aestuariivita sp.]MCY4346355.1 hypothetical protein [Aestuariivita sp.]